MKQQQIGAGMVGIFNNVERIKYMAERIEMLKTIYGRFDEDKRLTSSR